MTDQHLASRGMPPCADKISSAKLLLVGAGGIGCELLKTLVQTGFRSIQVVDLDTIDVSNLNRQFLFRKAHVGQSKAVVACETVRSFTNNAHKLNLVAHHKNIKSEEFNTGFFQSFDLVLNALDNVNARQHVNRMCWAANVPLIDAGTTGYLGQTSVIKRGETQCFDCEPKKEDKAMRFPICTIRSTPDKPVHCIVWAKELFKLIFGNARESDLVDLDEAAKDSVVMNAVRPFDLVKPERYAETVFTALFEEDIKLKKEMRKSETYNPTPLVLSEILCEPLPEPRNTSAKQVWTLRECWDVFSTTMHALLQARKGKELEFDKDDDLAMRFVCAAANLRSQVFHIERKNLFEVKGIAGNIIHAIATTNAIVAGIQVLEAIKLLSVNCETSKDCRFVWVTRAPTSGGQMLLIPCKLDAPEPKCVTCGKAELQVYLDLERSTFENIIVDVLMKRVGLKSPMVSLGHSLLYECGEELDAEEVEMYTRNLKKRLVALPGCEGRNMDGVPLEVSDYFQNMSFRLTLRHRKAKLDETSGELVGDLFELTGEAPKEKEEEEEETDDGDNKRAKIQDEEDELEILY